MISIGPVGGCITGIGKSFVTFRVPTHINHIKATPALFEGSKQIVATADPPDARAQRVLAAGRDHAEHGDNHSGRCMHSGSERPRR